MVNKSFSLKISVFYGRSASEEGLLVGYDALIEGYALMMPLPNNLTLFLCKA